MALDIRLKRDIAAGTAWTVEKINPLTSLASIFLPADVVA